MRKPLSILCLLTMAITVLCPGCDGGGDGGIPPGTAPRINWVELYLWGGPYVPTFEFTIGDQVEFLVSATDPDLDIKTLYITQYYPSDETAPYYGPDPLSLPSQSDPDALYWPLAPTEVTGPVGDWRIEFQIYDNRGNASNVYTIYILIN
jgi:hypothetical protein